MNPLDAAVATVLAVTNHKMLSALATVSDEDFLEMHQYLGPYVRELIGLEDTSSPIVEHFNRDGITSPDGMSLLILLEARDELRDTYAVKSKR